MNEYSIFKIKVNWCIVAWDFLDLLMFYEWWKRKQILWVFEIVRHTSYCKKRRFFTSTRVFLWKNLWNCVVQQMLDVCKWCKCKWCKWCLMYVNEYVQIECRLELEKGVDCLVLTTGYLDLFMIWLELIWIPVYLDYMTTSNNWTYL